MQSNDQGVHHRCKSGFSRLRARWRTRTRRPRPIQRPQRPQRRPRPPHRKAWSSMSPQQQQLLHGYQDKWDSLPPERQQALAKGSQRWLSMTPRTAVECAAALHVNGAPCRRSSAKRCGSAGSSTRACRPEQQQRVRESFNRFRQMPPETAHGIAQAVASDESRTAPQRRSSGRRRRRTARRDSTSARPVQGW